MKNLIKSSLLNIAAIGYYASGAYNFANTGKVLILMYHRVVKTAEVTSSLQPGMYVTDATFEKHLAFLASNYTVLPFENLLNLWQNDNIERGSKYCIITFDDGWHDNYRNAYPLLVKYHLPATIFLPVSFVGTNKWFWPDILSSVMDNHLTKIIQSEALESNIIVRAIKGMAGLPRRHTMGYLADDVIEYSKSCTSEQIRNALDEIVSYVDFNISDSRVIINWKEVEEMSQNNVSFGSHGCDHQILTKLPHSEILHELNSSREILMSRPINYLNVFCYPNGSYNDTIKRLAAEAGYDAAVTTANGFEGSRPKDIYALKRIGIHNDISHTVPLYSFHLSGIKKALF